MRREKRLFMVGLVLLGILLMETQTQKVWALYDEGEFIFEREKLLKPGTTFAEREIILKLKHETIVIGNSSSSTTLDTEQLKVQSLFQKQGIQIQKIKKFFPSQQIKDSVIKQRTEKRAFLSEDRRKRIEALEEGFHRWYKITLEMGEDVLGVTARLKQNPMVEYIGPNPIAKFDAIPNDELFSHQWPLDNQAQPYLGIKRVPGPNNDEQILKFGTADSDIDFPEALEYLTNKNLTEVIVAVVDSGIDYNHEDLIANMWINKNEIPDNLIDDDDNGYIDDYYGYDFWSGDSNPIDEMGHGTHVAGTIAAITNNVLGIAGIAQKVKIMAIRGISSEAVLGIKYAVDNGAKVIQNSWSYDLGIDSPMVQEAIEYAYLNNCIVVFSAGNTGEDTFHFPSAGEYVISVAATDSDDHKASFSTYGSWLDVSAPGVDILSLKANNTDMYAGGTTPEPIVHIVNDKYYLANGTSMAAPHVSGLAALIWSLHPEFTNDQIEQVIKVSCDDVLYPTTEGNAYPGWDTYSGFGRINAWKALQIESPLSLRIFHPDYIANFHNTTEIISIRALAKGSNFQNYTLQYAYTFNPKENDWITITSYRNPQTGEVTADLSLNGFKSGGYLLRLQAWSIQGEVYEDRFPLSVVTMLPGFPIPDLGVLFSYTVVNDIDNDKKVEIINADRYNVFIWDYQGQLKRKVNFDSLYQNYGQYPSTISIGEIDSAVLGKELTFIDGRNMLHKVYQSGVMDGGQWPITAIRGWNKDAYKFPNLYDLNLDGEDEIVFFPDTIGIVSPPYILTSSFFIFDSTGINRIIPYYDTEYRFIHTIPAFGQLDDDPELEIVFIALRTDSYKTYDPLARKAKVFAYNLDGSMVQGSWPLVIDSYFLDATPITADLNNDGYDEVIFRCGTTSSSFYTNNDGIYVLDRQGNLIWHTLIRQGAGASKQSAVADLDNDGDLEIVVNAKELYVFHHDGRIVEGTWPIEISFADSPAIGDLDGDGDQEIVILKEAGSVLYAFHHNGAIVEGFPLNFNTSFTLDTPTIADIDQNGDLEIVIAVGFLNAKMCAINVERMIPGENELRVDWPTYAHDAQHSGRYTKPNTPSEISPVSNQQVYEGSQLFFYVRATDPDSDPLTYSARLADGQDLTTIGAKFTTPVLGDFDLDGDVDMTDLRIFSLAFGAIKGQINYNPLCDFDNDGDVDGTDMVVFANNYGTTNYTGIKAGLFEWKPAKLQGKKDYYLIFSVTDNKSAPVEQTITITVLIPGDFDKDGDVDGSDLTIFASAFGSTKSAVNYNPAVDFDKDGDVDGSDLRVFSGNFGRASTQKG